MSLVKTTRKEDSLSTGVTEGVTPELLRTVLSATLQEKQPDVMRETEQRHGGLSTLTQLMPEAA